jgi:hypothetical protein
VAICLGSSNAISGVYTCSGLNINTKKKKKRSQYLFLPKLRHTSAHINAIANVTITSVDALVTRDKVCYNPNSSCMLSLHASLIFKMNNYKHTVVPLDIYELSKS